MQHLLIAETVAWQCAHALRTKVLKSWLGVTDQELLSSGVVKGGRTFRKPVSIGLFTDDAVMQSSCFLVEALLAQRMDKYDPFLSLYQY